MPFFLAISAFIGSLALPTWAVLLPPLIFGFPHLLSSSKTIVDSTKTALGQRGTSHSLWIGFIVLWSMTALLKISMRTKFIAGPLWWADFFAFSSTGLGIALVCFYFRVFTPRRLAILMLASAVAIYWPLQILSPLMFVHNAIALVFMERQSVDRTDRRTTQILIWIYVIGTVLILTGLCPFGDSHDWLVKDTQVELASIAKYMAPWIKDPLLLTRIAIAFGFGQIIHYQIWLKEMPSLREFTRQKSFHITGCLSLIVIVLLWKFHGYFVTRTAYFSIATFHIPAEIACLVMIARPSHASRT